MANRSLGAAEIGKLVSISAQRASVIDSRQQWPGRENNKLLAQAVKDRRPLVVFNTGRLFKIRYTKHFGGSVYVSPDDGSFSPCGYFSIHRLESSLNAIEGLEDYVD